MSKQQEVIRKFVNALDNGKSLDEAVRECSKFNGMDDLKKHFITDLQANGGRNRWMQKTRPFWKITAA